MLSRDNYQLKSAEAERDEVRETLKKERDRRQAFFDCKSVHERLEAANKVIQGVYDAFKADPSLPNRRALELVMTYLCEDPKCEGHSHKDLP